MAILTGSLLAIVGGVGVTWLERARLVNARVGEDDINRDGCKALAMELSRAVVFRLVINLIRFVYSDLLCGNFLQRRMLIDNRLAD